MIRSLAILTLLAAAASAEEDRPDLLRLTNGELEGRFGGIDKNGVLRWERDDGIAPMEFKTDKVRQVVLRGATSLKPDGETSHLHLVNDDRIPGRVVALDAETITFESPIGGSMVIPRNTVKTLAPNPFGGRLVYAGPFTTDSWRVIGEEGEKEDPFAEPKEDDKEKGSSWRHIGSKWYHTGGTDGLVMDSNMPDQSIFRFTLEWRSKPPIAIGFHADFAAPPEPDEKEEENDEAGEKIERRAIVRNPSNGFVSTFGNSLVLTIRSSYAQLYHCGYNEDGEPFSDQVRSSSTTVRFEDVGKSDFEIRTDRTEGTVSLFVNGEYSMQWKVDLPENADEEEPKPKVHGGGIGFQLLDNETPVRISDIIIAEWNGMPDSAKSLESQEHDIVLLTNGTDRFSGKVESVQAGNLSLKGQYAHLSIPLEEIAEVRFAGSGIRELEESNDREVRVHFEPLGQVSGVPGPTQGDTMQLRSTILGDLKINLESAVILEFQSGNRFLNYWDEDL